jgi:SAM-dependent methyltransferase
LLKALDGCAALAASAADESVLDVAVAAALNDCLAELTPLAIWGPDNRLPSSDLWNACGHHLARGWLQNQARMKPRGYAGDYEMLARIYDRRLCDDPLGRSFDRYFQSEAAPRAVRNRMRMMADWIVAAAGEASQTPRTIAVVGAALGLEARDALLRLSDSERRRLRFVLLDLDPAAIEFGRQQLAGLLAPAQLTAAPANLFRLAERPRLAEPLQGADWIFCPGLFDYLDDAAAAAMLRCLYEHLAPGGRLILFQFAPHNPTRAYMEWFGNWYLLYRDAEQLARLVAEAGLRAEFGAEAEGIDLLAHIAL